MAKQQNQLTVFEDQLAALATESVKAEQASLQTTFLSTKGGTLTYRGDPVANNKLACVILTGPIERLYYSSRYDPTKIVPPDCFAIGTSATEMAPAASAPKPQHSKCDGCPMNEWGSSPTGGKGKACRETRRLLLVPADAISTPDAVKSAEVAALRPPVTSLKNYANYVQTIAATLKRPPLAVISEISVAPDAKTQFKVNFSMVKPIDDTGVIQALIERSKEELEKAVESAGMIAEGDHTQEVAVADSGKY